MTDTPLPPQIDGEPDWAAEVARLDTEIKVMAESLAPAESELRTSMKAMEIGDADYAKLIASLDELIPAETKADAPKNLSRMDELMWRVTTAAETLKRPVVPATDAKRPDLQTPTEDFSTLPAHARIARGYAA